MHKICQIFGPFITLYIMYIYKKEMSLFTLKVTGYIIPHYNDFVGNHLSKYDPINIHNTHIEFNPKLMGMLPFQLDYMQIELDNKLNQYDDENNMKYTLVGNLDGMRTSRDMQFHAPNFWTSMYKIEELDYFDSRQLQHFDRLQDLYEHQQSLCLNISKMRYILEGLGIDLTQCMSGTFYIDHNEE